jgi:GGDEF domain-containing protein
VIEKLQCVLEKNPDVTEESGRGWQAVVSSSFFAQLAEARRSRSPSASPNSGACLDLPTLLAHADAAMYEAKRAGGGCWRLYEDSEQATAVLADPR